MSLLLSGADVEFPYSGHFSLNSTTEPYKLTVSGRVSANPDQMAINIDAGGARLLHFNPRWNAGRIVINDHPDSKGFVFDDEVYASLPESLKANSDFTVVIAVADETFTVTVNGESEPVVVFKQRVPADGLEREVYINKVEQHDFTVSSVKVEAER